MARGPRKHMKRLNAPKHWMLDKLGGTWAPRPSAGPHKLRECLPVSLILRNRLRYALTRREVLQIVMRKSVQIDGHVRTDINYPAGFQDVISIPKTSEQFRLLYDVKGRFVLHRITPEEASYKLVRVQKVDSAKKASIGHNPFQHGQLATVPYVVTHDGRTIRFADPAFRVNDSVKLDLKSGRPVGHLKFDVGQLAMITRGANVGRVGTIVSVEKHPGSFDIAHLKDRRGNTFATRIGNVFIVGDGAKPAISLPRAKGVKLTVIEERDGRLSKKE